MGTMPKIHDLKGQEMVVIPRKEYDRLRRIAADEESLLDALDSAAAQKQLAKIKAGTITLAPHAVVKAIIVDRLHPVRAFREHKGWTAEQLAKKSKLARAAITHIETRKRKGTVEAYQSIAKALDVSVDALLT